MKVSFIILAPTVALAMFIGIFILIVHQPRVLQNSKRIEKISGVSLDGERSYLEVSNYSQLIVAYVDMSCGVCKREIEDLILLRRDNESISVILVTEESLNSLRNNKTICNFQQFPVLSITRTEARGLNFNDFPHFRFYRDGKLLKEHIGKINVVRYSKNVFE